ncbi:hypothetical protein AB0J48_07475 [Nocardia salmonicida]|uniref:hypothetical protein n=1 Tax=Nocardia salmonicida TaxID=53431 RepID=UPI00342E280A
MKITRLVGACAASLSALVLTSTVAAADPLSVDIAPGVNYTAYQDGTAAVVKIEHGTLIVDNGQFQIRSSRGDVLAGVPLEFNVDDIAFPIDVDITGDTARLTPAIDPARAYYRPVALPNQEQAPWKSAYDREQAAWSRMTSTISMGAAVGALVGAVGAGTIGCLLGGVTAGIATGPLALLFGAGPLAGCLIGAAAMAPIGVLSGAIFVGAPVAIAAVIQYQDTVNAPFPAQK